MPPATVELYDYTPGLDDAAKVVLVMADADWAAMRNSPPLKDVPPGRWSSTDALLLPENRGAWRPGDDPAVLATQVQLPNAESLTIGHAPAGSGRTRIWLFWHQT